MSRIQFRLLGPLQVYGDGDGRPLRLAPREQALLAALLLEANQVVPTDQLIERLWGDRASVAARNTLHVLVRRLRRALQAQLCHQHLAELIVRRPPGYLFRVEPGQLDLHHFEEALRQAKQAETAGDLERAIAYLRAGLGLWRGAALAGVPAEGLHQVEVPRLEERRLAALEHRIDLELKLGRHADLIGELRALVGEHPLRERAWEQLMLALYRAGRQADALQAYQAARRVLAEELGLEPGSALQRLQRAILAADPELVPMEPVAVRPLQAPPPGSSPHQLPPDVVSFTGRQQELEELRAILTRPVEHRTSITVIGGMAGVGKSALAIHAAHAHSERFPDGQLYADLQGSSVGLLPLQPHEVLGRFLRALGVESACIPSAVEEQAALFRSLLTGRRMLIMLDNAASADQVRPLRPAGVGSAVLVTSRQSLTELDGVTHLYLEPLPRAQAVALLGRLAGPERIGAEPVAAAKLAELCGDLPLALRIAGARLAARPSWSVSVLAERLADQSRRLDELQSGNLAVRASFQVTYQTLLPQEARAFRMLSLLESPDVGLGSAAALLDEPPQVTEAALERLVDAHLLETPAPGRYRFHDLLRLFARQRTADEDPEPLRNAALALVFGHYLAGARQADRLLRPGHPDKRDHHTRPPPFDFGDGAQALAWLDGEHANLVAAAYQAATTRGVCPTVCSQLSIALFGFLDLRGAWSELERITELALRVAGQHGDTRGQAEAHRALGALAWRRHQLEQALRHLEASLELFRRISDQRGEAESLNNLGLVHFNQRHYQDAIACFRRALELSCQLADRRGRSRALNNLGDLYRAQGRYHDALHCLEQDLEICHQLDDRRGEAITLHNLGEVYRAQTRYQEAVAAYKRSLAICRELRDRRGEGLNLSTIGKTLRRQGRLEEASTCLRQARQRLAEVGDRYGEASALWQLGLVVDALGDRGAARACWQQAQAMFEQVDAHEANHLRALLTGQHLSRSSR